MIKTFAHKGLKELFEKGRTAKINKKMQERCKEILDLLNAATKPSEMDLPGWNTHQLKQYKPLRWSVWVSGPWRITYEFTNGDAYRVDFEQYH